MTLSHPEHRTLCCAATLLIILVKEGVLRIVLLLQPAAWAISATMSSPLRIQQARTWKKLGLEPFSVRPLVIDYVFWRRGLQEGGRCIEIMGEYM
jgi:hypothetical protein